MVPIIRLVYFKKIDLSSEILCPIQSQSGQPNVFIFPTTGERFNKGGDGI